MSRSDRAAASALVELVRLPAVLSVPGDSLLGAAASGRTINIARGIGLATSSSLLYLGGMALNDYADREVDSHERPHRPIPSGRVSERTALHIAQGLTAGGIVVAGLAGGRRSFTLASVLAANVWAYDLLLKNTPFGPASMATCRALDVMLGTTPGSLRKGLLPASIIGTHILAVTTVSRAEVQGGSPMLAKRALLAAQCVTGVGALFVARSAGRNWLSKTVGFKSLALYLGPLEQAAGNAISDPSPANLQHYVGAGVLGIVPLQAALISGSRKPKVGAAVAALWPLARHFSKKRSVT